MGQCFDDNTYFISVCLIYHVSLFVCLNSFTSTYSKFMNKNKMYELQEYGQHDIYQPSLILIQFTSFLSDLVESNRCPHLFSLAFFGTQYLYSITLLIHKCLML